MPNWCTGSIKLRGKPENILRFVKEGLNVYPTGSDEPMDKELWLQIKDYGREKSIFFNGENIPKYNSIYIEGTRRAFILWDVGNDLFIDSEKPIWITSFGFKQAWNISPHEFAPIAKEYDLDIHLYGIECGMGFINDYEIINHGRMITDHSIDYGSYDEFNWNCPFPWMGG